MSTATITRPASIRCAHCKDRHATVERVRECAEVEAMYRETCEHGLSAWLCSGPNHYGEPEDEMRDEGWM